MTKLSSFAASFFKENYWKVEPEASEIKLFGIIMSINFPIYWFIWHHINDEIDIVLRLIATLLCVGLLLKNFWPQRWLQFFIPYWYFTLIFCLPFFFTFMLLKHQVSAIWLMNCMSALFFNLLIIPIVGFFITVTVGISLGMLAFFFFIADFQINLGTIDVYSIFWTFFAAIIIGASFSQHKVRLQEEKLEVVKILAGTIAHEMRTPLLGLTAMAYRLKTHLPQVIRGFEQSSLSFEDKNSVKLIKDIPESMEHITRGAFNIIDILLMNLREGVSNEVTEICFIDDCIEKALTDYHLSEEEESFIFWEKGINFNFKGSPVLIKHVLFNLLKNALHYVKAANKGSITIHTAAGKDYNTLHFKDTGQGIPASMLPHIFKRFYSRTTYGTGIGLAFCKGVMEGLGGSITCHSVEGEYTEFILSFPKTQG